jgi:hypothetical protein
MYKLKKKNLRIKKKFTNLALITREKLDHREILFFFGWGGVWGLIFNLETFFI